MKDHKNTAINTVVLLQNATGATFEDESMAVDIIENLLKEDVKGSLIDFLKWYENDENDVLPETPEEIVSMYFISMAKRKALLYSYSDDKYYEIKIDSNIDLSADNFDWENKLLEPIQENGEYPDVDNGVSWGWA